MLITTQNLLNAISKRTTSWSLTKVFKEAKKAKKYAAKLFVNSQGVKVVSQFNHDHKEIFYVMEWTRRP